MEELQQKRKGKALTPALASKRVLAFAPDVLPLQYEDEADFRAAVMGLVQVRPLLQSSVNRPMGG